MQFLYRPLGGHSIADRNSAALIKKNIKLQYKKRFLCLCYRSRPQPLTRRAIVFKHTCLKQFHQQKPDVGRWPGPTDTVMSATLLYFCTVFLTGGRKLAHLLHQGPCSKVDIFHMVLLFHVAICTSLLITAKIDTLHKKMIKKTYQRRTTILCYNQYFETCCR